MDDPVKEDLWIHKALRRGDHRRALELLARTHGPRLGRLCFAMTGDQAEAEELTQEILIGAFRAMPSFEGRSSIRTWLYTIARRTCSKALQKRRRRRRLLAATDLPGAPPPHQHEDGLETRRRLRGAMAQLSEPQQEVLLLHHVSGLSYREVGRVCGIREDAARQRAAAGINKLRRLLAVEPRPAMSANQNGRVVKTCQELSS